MCVCVCVWIRLGEINWKNYYLEPNTILNSKENSNFIQLTKP